MRSKPQSCVGCSCHAHGTDFSAVEGTGSLGVMLVGEASGEHEQRDGLPFRPHAPAGAVLTRILRRMGLARDQFAITNCLRCRPRNNWLVHAPWEFSSLNHCRPNLDAAIAAYRPRAIVALGGIPLRELTGLAGEQRGVSHLSGYVLPGPVGAAGPIPVVPTFHPAFLRRGKASYQGIVARHIHRAIRIAAGQDRDWQWNVIPESKETHGPLTYHTRPTPAQVDALVDYVRAHPEAVVSYDIETAESASLDEDARDGYQDTVVRLIQFCVRPGEAFALDWTGGNIAAARAILAAPNVKCGHNLWLFDNKVLRAASERDGLGLVIGGTVHDTLQMFHHWQPDLPAHLQAAAQFVSFPFPWKHLAATDLEFYGCCDVDATLRLYTFLEGALKREGLWDDSPAEVAA